MTSAIGLAACLWCHQVEAAVDDAQSPIVEA
jgi:hypothetical protein